MLVIGPGPESGAYSSWAPRRPVCGVSRPATWLAFTLLAAGTGRAALLDLGNVTRDASTDLDWFDLTETEGMSFEEVAAGGSGFLAAGWQIAGESDFCLLLVTCAVPPSPCPGDFGTPQPGNANEFMIGLFGVTLQGPNTIEFDGVYDNGTFNHGFAFVYYSFTDDFSIRGVFGNRLPPPLRTQSASS